MEFSVSNATGRAEKKTYWKYLPGLTPRTMRYPITILGRAPAAVRELFTDIEDMLQELRKDQEKLKALYKALKKFSKNDPVLAEDLKEFIRYVEDDRLKYDKNN
jgi:hypothetical protein